MLTTALLPVVLLGTAAPARAADTPRELVAQGAGTIAPLPGTGYVAVPFGCAASASGAGLETITITSCAVYDGNGPFAGGSSEGTVAPNGAGSANYSDVGVSNAYQYRVCWTASAFYGNVVVKGALIQGEQTLTTRGCVMFP